MAKQKGWRRFLHRSEREFGDFQTPQELVNEILSLLCRLGFQWSRTLEPTCGLGNFIEASLQYSTEVSGVELQQKYFRHSADRFSNDPTVSIRQGDVFQIAASDFHWKTSGRLLIVGNPPWVTNSELGLLNSPNLPTKTNLRGLPGIEAITGSANFDLTEAVWIRLIKEFLNEQPIIALLCKTSVARAVLDYCRGSRLPVQNCKIYKIDAVKHFAAAVDACLFVLTVGWGTPKFEAEVFSSLDSLTATNRIGFSENGAVFDLDRYEEIRFLDGKCQKTWRQGLKHDAAAVMELSWNGNSYKNAGGDEVDVESEYVYPLIKTADFVSSDQTRAVIVPQKLLGENTEHLRVTAPKLWAYLTAHQEIFASRKSSIYKTQPRFAVFGIGDYTFAPFKVAVSGFLKKPLFKVIAPSESKPVILDDTCYFIDCKSLNEASTICDLLNDSLTSQFLEAICYRDAKRPITKAVLQRIDLIAVARNSTNQANRAALADFIANQEIPATQATLSF